MKFLEFKDKIKEIYSSKFPNSICNISLGSLGRDTAYIKWYLMKDSSEVSGGIAGNDLFHIMFILETEQEVDLLDDTELPEKIILSVHQNSITTKPTNQYMAYGSTKLPFRKTTNTPEKILSTLQKYVDITYKTLDELYDLDVIPDSFKELVTKKLNKQPKTEDKNITLKEDKEMEEQPEIIKGAGSNAKDIANTFRNYTPFEKVFGQVIVIKQDGTYFVYLPQRNNQNDWIYMTDKKDNLEGWFYGAVQVNNGIIPKLKTENKIAESSENDMDELPDYCYIYVESTKEIAVVRKYVEGYFPTDVDTSDMTTEQAYAYVDKQNEFLGVTPEQRDEMKRQSMFGWKTKKEDKLNESRENDVQERIKQAEEWKKTLSNIKPNMENAVDLLEDLVYDIKESIKSLSEKNFAAEDLHNVMLDVLDDADAMDAGEKTYIKSVKVNMENAIDDFINDYQQACEEENLKESKLMENSLLDILTDKDKLKINVSNEVIKMLQSKFNVNVIGSYTDDEFEFDITGDANDVLDTVDYVKEQTLGKFRFFRQDRKKRPDNKFCVRVTLAE